MLLILECVVGCILFTLLILSLQYKDPMNYIMSYPPAIRRRVEQLPQYKNVIHNRKKRHITVKIAAAFLLAGGLALVAYFSGAREFVSAYVHVFLLFFSVNIYDMLVLDIGLFCHSRKLRIPGTEDMEKEYKDPWFHVIGAGKGIVIGAVVALLSAGIVWMMP